jgi:hypothetical protein
LACARRLALRDTVTGIGHKIVETDRFPGNDDLDQIRDVASRQLRRSTRASPIGGARIDSSVFVDPTDARTDSGNSAVTRGASGGPQACVQRASGRLRRRPTDPDLD